MAGIFHQNLPPPIHFKRDAPAVYLPRDHDPLTAIVGRLHKTVMRGESPPVGNRDAAFAHSFPI